MPAVVLVQVKVRLSPSVGSLLSGNRVGLAGLSMDIFYTLDYHLVTRNIGRRSMNTNDVFLNLIQCFLRFVLKCL